MVGQCGQRNPNSPEVLRAKLQEARLKTRETFERVEKARAELCKAESEYSLAAKKEIEAGKRVLEIIE